jgi:hypothetical protein
VVPNRTSTRTSRRSLVQVPVIEIPTRGPRAGDTPFATKSSTVDRHQRDGLTAGSAPQLINAASNTTVANASSSERVK